MTPVTPGCQPVPSDVLRPTALMDDAEADMLAFMGLPDQHRAKIFPTTPLDRLDRRSALHQCCRYPAKWAAVITLVGALPLEQTENLAMQRQETNVETLALPGAHLRGQLATLRQRDEAQPRPGAPTGSVPTRLLGQDAGL